MDTSLNTRSFGPPDTRQPRRPAESTSESNGGPLFQQYLEPPTAATRPTASQPNTDPPAEATQDVPTSLPPSGEGAAAAADSADPSASRTDDERSKSPDSPDNDDLPLAAAASNPVSLPPAPTGNVVPVVAHPGQTNAEQQQNEQLTPDALAETDLPGDVLETGQDTPDSPADAPPSDPQNASARSEQQPEQIPIVKIATIEPNATVRDAAGRPEAGERAKTDRAKRRAHRGTPAEPNVTRPTTPDRVAKVSAISAQTATIATADTEAEPNRSATDRSLEEPRAASKPSETESASRLGPAKSELANRLLSRSSQQTEEQRSLTQAEQTRLVRRVARGIQRAANRNGTLQLRLRPAELGSLRLEVTIEQGNLSARIETETHMARTALLDALPQLRDRLTEQGIRIEQFQVNVGGQGGGEQPQQSRHGQLETVPHARSQSPRSDEHEPPKDPSLNRLATSSGELNVIV